MEDIKNIESIVNKAVCDFLHTGTASGYKLDASNNHKKTLVKKSISDIDSNKIKYEDNSYVTDVFNEYERCHLKCLLMELNNTDMQCVLGYDEMYVVLEGTLIIHYEGRKIEVKNGDIVSVFKGDSVTFSTPFYTKFLRIINPK
ncbi:transcriptional regulator [Brachyspira hampsonii]|uniref:transcriptional regulator n=1 Tax=Brachyspira hampsonii TaxID=1287055 RepID=UPI000D346CAB|nr:transcriptional regulator [Brachyspira hampsonii]PTY40402.1 transcriptional regulator [Brachyspira hampsonii bv. II]